MGEREQRLKIDQVGPTSGDVLEVQIKKLRDLFPEVFVEGKIDFDKLKINSWSRCRIRSRTFSL